LLIRQANDKQDWNNF